jgi:hypothetical protein
LQFTTQEHRRGNSQFAGEVENVTATSGEIGTLPLINEWLPDSTRYSKDSIGSLRYEHVSRDEITLVGVVKHDSVAMRLRKANLDTMAFHHDRVYPIEWRRRLALWAFAHGLPNEFPE